MIPSTGIVHRLQPDIPKLPPSRRHTVYENISLGEMAVLRVTSPEEYVRRGGTAGVWGQREMCSQVRIVTASPVSTDFRACGIARTCGCKAILTLTGLGTNARGSWAPRSVAAQRENSEGQAASM